MSDFLPTMIHGLSRFANSRMAITLFAVASALFLAASAAISVALADRFTKHICQAANITKPNVESAATIPGQFQPCTEL